MRITRFFPLVLSLAVSGCGGCVNPDDANGAAANGANRANRNSGSTPQVQGPGAGGGKTINHVTTTSAMLRAVQSATLKDGG